LDPLTKNIGLALAPCSSVLKKEEEEEEEEEERSRCLRSKNFPLVNFLKLLFSDNIKLVF
jgi:hypothetical protein